MIRMPSQHAPKTRCVSSPRNRDTAVTASLCARPNRVTSTYDRSLPTIVMSVPWSVVTIADGVSGDISRARNALIACGIA
jgi:hypothetical protein